MTFATVQFAQAAAAQGQRAANAARGGNARRGGNAQHDQRTG
jgi:hypothetical protein